MIGDDIISDVGGAQACGIRGVQVRTGKYRFVRSHDTFTLCTIKLRATLLMLRIINAITSTGSFKFNSFAAYLRRKEGS